MKIDKNKYPVIEMFAKNKIGKVNFIEDFSYAIDHIEYYRDEIYQVFAKTKKVQIVSKKIQEIIYDQKTQKKMLEHKQILKPSYGVIIFNNKQFIYEVDYFDVEGYTEKVKRCFFFCFKEKNFIAYQSFDLVDGEFRVHNPSSRIFSAFEHQYLPSLLVNTLLFIQFAEIETKIIDSTDGKNRKLRTDNDVYINETDSILEIIDSKYFTNIHRTIGFKVSGHFRLQACGEKLRDRKLIWIDEFEKTGYHREAGRSKSDDAIQ